MGSRATHNADRIKATKSCDYRIAVVLSTYNGERFLAELLESLREQDHPIDVIVRDDGSTDNTLDILRNFKNDFPQCEIIEGKNLGVVESFSRLLECVVETYDYVALCDQDDVWLPDKISNTLEVLRHAEESYGNSAPILAHTDLQVVDDSMRVISASFWRAQQLNIRGIKLERLLTQNVVTGCSMMVNAALLKQALPVPRAAIMHDWWLTLCAALKGHIVSLSAQTICYRQHSSNLVGLRPYTLSSAFKKLSSVGELHDQFAATVRQAEALCHHFETSLSHQEKSLLRSYVTLPNLSRSRRLCQVFKRGYLRQGMYRNIGFFLTVLTFPVNQRH